jgi:hypothetical protein
MVKENVDWLHFYLCIGQKEFAGVAKYTEELYKYLSSGKKIAVKDVEIYQVEKYEGVPKDGLE